MASEFFVITFERIGHDDLPLGGGVHMALKQGLDLWLRKVGAASASSARAVD